jgi:internalin A
MLEYPFHREIESPVTPEQLRPLDARCRRVQFCRPLSEADHKALAGFLRQYPHVWLRAYGPYVRDFDLDFLRHYPSLRHVTIEVFDLKNLEGLHHLSPELESFGLGQTKRKVHSLSALRRFPRLRRLYLDGHTKDIDVISSLSRLDDLTLRSITLPDLSMLRPLKQLRSLDVKLGGTKNLDLLPEIGQLRYLELWMIRGFTDLRPIASVRTLQFLFLQALKNVDAIPSLARLPVLRRVHLETMKGLTDLRSVAEAPALEDLVAIDMSQLSPEAFRPFVGHPTLRRASVGLGSLRKNQAVTDLLSLPSAGGDFTFDDSTGISVEE